MLDPADVLTVTQFLSRTQAKREFYLRPFVPKDATITVFGAANSGKSFFAVELALGIASGFNLHAFDEVHRAPVLFIAAEGDTSTERRVTAWKRRHEVGDEALTDLRFWIATRLDLASKEDTAEIVAVCQRHAVEVVVIDSLTYGLLKHDTNSGAAYGAAFDSLRSVLATTGVRSIILISHVGKDPKRDQRGHSVAGDVPDLTLRVTGKKGKEFCVDFEKQREGLYTDKTTFKLKKLDFADSDETPWIERVATTDSNVAGLSADQQAIINCLLTATSTFGQFEVGRDGVRYQKLHRDVARDSLRKARFHLKEDGSELPSSWFGNMLQRQWFTRWFVDDGQHLWIAEDKFHEPFSADEPT